MERKNNLLTLVVIIGLAVIGYGTYSFFNKESLRFITIDVNPSVELAVNEDGEVEEVIPLNEDADIILANLELNGLQMDEAIKIIIDSATEAGYIDEYSEENAILVTTYSEDEEERQELEEDVLDVINEHIEDRNINSLVFTQGVTDEIKTDAETYGISNGKMLLVERAYALDSTLGKDELATMSIKDIQGGIKDAVKERRAAIRENEEDLEEFLKVQMEDKKTERLARVTDMVEELSEDIGDEDLSEDEIKALLNAKKADAKQELDRIKEELKPEMPAVDNSKREQNFNFPIDRSQYTTIKEKIKDRRDEERGNNSTRGR